MLRRLSLIPTLVSLFLIWILTFLIFEKNGDIFVSHPNVWGDWAAHFTYTMHFAIQPVSRWFSTNPIFAGEKLHYPFLINFFSAILVKMGMGISNSLRFTSLAAMLGAVWLIHKIYRNLLERRGPDVALLLTLFGGGMGWVLYLRDVLSHPSALFSPAFDYGHLPNLGLDVGGTLTCLWLPQRGLPLAVVAAAPLLLSLTGEKAPSRGRQIAAGLSAGLLPIIHVHTLICASAAVFWFIVDKRKSLRAYLPVLLSFLVTAGALWILYHHDTPSASFLAWQRAKVSSPITSASISVFRKH